MKDEYDFSNAEQGKFYIPAEEIQICANTLAHKETAYLLKSETMKQRLLTAKNREEGMSFGEICEKLGI